LSEIWSEAHGQGWVHHVPDGCHRTFSELIHSIKTRA